MPLKMELDALDGIDESLHSIYRQDDDGRYRLDVEGMPDVAGLKNALNQERENVSSLKQRVKAYGDLDPDKVRSLREEVETLRKTAKGAPSEDDLNALVEERIQSRLQDNQRAADEKYSALASKYEQVSSVLETTAVRDALRRVGAEIGVAEGEPMEDFIMRGRSIFRMVDGEVKPMDDKGETIYGSDGIATLSMKEWGEGLAKKAPHLFKSSSGGGAANQGGSPGGARAVRSKADLGKKGFPSRGEFINENGHEAYLALPKD
jgi:hypothetical protein